MANVDALAASFDEFCKVSGNKNGRMTNKAWSKLCKDTQIEDKKKWTATDTDIVWSQCFKTQKEVDFATFKKGLTDVICKEYGKKMGIDQADALGKLCEKIQSGGVKMNKTTGTSKTGNVEKMTDASQYTGAHKERFDESGKGKGIAGRADVASNDGYVQGYKSKDTYEK